MTEEAEAKTNETTELVNPVETQKQTEEAALQKAMEEIASTHRPTNPKTIEDVDKEIEEELKRAELAGKEEGQGEETTEEGAEDAEAEEATEEPEEGEKKEEPKEQTWTVKINGEERQVDEKELIRGYQKSSAADEKFQEAAKMREIFNNVADRIGEDVFRVAMDFYVGKDKLDPQTAYTRVLDQAKKIVVHDWNMRNMPEEERRKYEEGLELEKLRRENVQLRQTKEKQAQEEAIAKETDKLLFQINKSIKEVGLPEDDLTVSDVAYKMQVMRAAGLDPTPLEAAEEYRKDLETRREREIRGLSADALIEKFPDIAEQVSKVFAEKRIAKTKEAIPQKGKTGKTAPSPKKEKASKGPKVIPTSGFMDLIRGRE